MKAAILTVLNKPLEVAELTPSKNLDPGQILVKVLCSTICGAQIREITGAKGPDKYLPHLLGHEGCGIVQQISDVRTGKLKVGDKVVMHWRKGKGIDAIPAIYTKEEEPKYGYHSYSKVGAGPVHTFCTEAIVSENRLTPISPDIPPRVASLLGCAVTTALGLITKEASLQIGQSIAVAGVGGVGLNIIQGASLVTAYPIIAIDRECVKLSMAPLYGATHCFDTNGTQDYYQELLSVCPKGVDVFVDCTGDPNIINKGLNLVAPGGKLILVGQPKDRQGLFFIDAGRNYTGKTIMDSQGGRTDPDVDIPRYIKLYEKGLLNLDTLVTNSFPLDNVNDAIELVKSGKVGRVALEM